MIHLKKSKRLSIILNMQLKLRNSGTLVHLSTCIKNFKQGLMISKTQNNINLCGGLQNIPQ